MMIITHSRKDLVKKQKACIDYVSRGIQNGKSSTDPKLQEAVQDLQRWSQDTKIYKNENSKGLRHIATFEGKDKNGKPQTR
jgi:hypothetical protein